MTAPYISVVVAARNDNYGGDFNIRLQDCINWFAHYANLYEISSEFLIVNYNPIDSQPQLGTTIIFPRTNFVDFKLVTVTNAFHNSITNENIRKPVPLYEYVAKNIGIRRATGEYIVSGNPDVIWDESHFKFIARRKLKRSNYYRADRCDFKSATPVLKPSTENLQIIRHAAFKIFMKGYKYEVDISGQTAIKLFLLSVKNQWVLFKELKKAKYDEISKKFNLNINYNNVEYQIHTNASGDFFMMHRDNWYRLKGHPENTYLSIHTDSISVAMARYAGLKETVYFFPVYHRDHDRRFVPEKREADVEAMYEQFENDAKWMRANNKPIIYNNDNWGYPNEPFEITVLS